MSKKIILITLILTLAGWLLYGSTQVNAQTTNSPFSAFVQKIAQKFGLKEADVQAVFDEAKNEKQAQAQARFEEYLTQLVKDGKITESQKQAIISKKKELLNQKEAKRQELESWVKEKGIDLQYFRGFDHHHFGMHQGFIK